MPAIFISHASGDANIAADIKHWLDDQGFQQVFLDIDTATGLGLGSRWERELYEKIEQSQAMIAVVTPAWQASKWCFAEFTSAQQQGKPIFPLIFAADGQVRVGPELQGIQTAAWDNAGKLLLARRLNEIASELARGYRWDPLRPPWPGILSYEPEDAAVFFGRDPEIRKVVGLLDASRVRGGPRALLIVGGSGSGKSSLLKAGVIPYLSRERRSWIVLPPFRPGPLPLTELAKVVSHTIGVPTSWRSLRDSMLEGHPESELASALEGLRIGASREATVLVSVDQLEEAFALAEPREKSGFTALVRGLANRNSSAPIALLATMRADLFGEVLNLLGPDRSLESLGLGPVPFEQLHLLIEGPARVAGISLEPGLAERILRDVATPESLPLLAFALRELNDRSGQEKRLTLTQYEALGDPKDGLSPLENTVKQKAEEAIYRSRATAAELAALKETFVGSLVSVDHLGRRLRRSAKMGDISAEARGLVDTLVTARLLSVRNQRDESVVEVAHEALFRAWPQLTHWLDEEQDFLIGRRQIEELERLWRSAPEHERPQALLGGLLLQRAEAWLAAHPGRLSDLREFIAASARRRQFIKRRRVLMGLGAAVAVGAGGTIATNALTELAAYRRIRVDEAARDDLNGQLTAFANSPEDSFVAQDKRGGTFTKAFVEALGDSSLSVTQALLRAGRQTLAATDGRQRPQFIINLNGDLYLHDPPAKRRTAVVCVGMGDYRALPRLRPALNDAANVADAFRSMRYSPILVTNATRGQMDDVIERAFRELAGGEIGGSKYASLATVPKIRPPPQNTVLCFYYSGHGVQIAGDDYIIPVDMPSPNTEDDIVLGGIRTSDLIGRFKQAAAASVIIFDASRGNPFASGRTTR